MPELTIQLRCDPQTGRRDIVVKLHDDEQLLPHEHEQLHRKLVNQLIEGGLLKSGDGSQLIVEREGDAGSTEASNPDSDERRPIGEGR